MERNGRASTLRQLLIDCIVLALAACSGLAGCTRDNYAAVEGGNDGGSTSDGGGTSSDGGGTSSNGGVTDAGGTDAGAISGHFATAVVSGGMVARSAHYRVVLSVGQSPG